MFDLAKDFEGKVALVTGGSRGLGADVVCALRQLGCRVIVLARNTSNVDCDLAINCDVAEEDQQLSSFEQVSDKFDRLDYVFINAGVTGVSNIVDIELADWDSVMNINLRGAFITLRESAKLMLRYGNGGSIVACCSLASLNPEKMISHYNASKAALASLVKTAAAEMGVDGIRVNGIAPGLTKTDLIAGTDMVPGYIEAITKRTPLGRLGEPSDITDTLLKLFTMHWVTGQLLVSDGGLSLTTASDITEFF